MNENLNKFIWPQENRKLMQYRIHKNQISKLSFIKNIKQTVDEMLLLIRAVLAFLGIGNFKKSEEKIMYIFNGSNTKQLTDKFEFLEICQKLNYFTPKQILIRKAHTINERKKLFENKFENDGFGFYIKPVKGFGGKGIRVLKTRNEVINILDEFEDDTIIEDAINIKKEFRYILYTDPDENNWHLSFEKTRSIVKGNGKTNVFSLIIKNNEIPKRRKIALFKNKISILKNIPKNGEELQLEHKCTYGKLPSEIEIKNLDKFASVFIKDLEEKIGHKLPILCFDLGATIDLNLELSLEELKKNIVPFECQMPFSPLAHFKFMKNGLMPFIDFYRMLISDMLGTINKRVEKI